MLLLCSQKVWLMFKIYICFWILPRFTIFYKFCHFAQIQCWAEFQILFSFPSQPEVVVYHFCFWFAMLSKSNFNLSKSLMALDCSGKESWLHWGPAAFRRVNILLHHLFLINFVVDKLEAHLDPTSIQPRSNVGSPPTVDPSDCAFTYPTNWPRMWDPQIL